MEDLNDKNRSMLVRIRRDEVELSEKSIRLNNRSVPAEDISGIRCNRLTLCIEVKVLDTVAIKIECKGFFRNDRRASDDFESIVVGIKSLLMPRVARNIAKHVFHGNNFVINSFSRLTHEGLWMTQTILPGSWIRSSKKRQAEIPNNQPGPSFGNSVVPYGKLEFRRSRGWLEIGPKGNPKQFYQQIDENAWNAVLIENVAHSVVSLVDEKKSLNRN